MIIAITIHVIHFDTLPSTVSSFISQPLVAIMAVIIEIPTCA